MRLVSTLIVCAAMVAAGCGGGDDGGSGSLPTAPSANVPFSITDLRVGTGAEATTGRTVTVRYAGWLYSTTAPDNKGNQFDAGTLPPFVLGTNVIPGFTMGIQGMRVGGLRRVVIPPDLAYGAQGRPPSIPGNSTLLFEIELLAVQ